MNQSEINEMTRMMGEDKEIWVDINGYDGNYKISQYGNLKSFKYSTSGNMMNGSTTQGYTVVAFTKNGIQKRYKCHRLVGEYFIPNPLKLTIIDHIDNNHLNNVISNLRWVNNNQNMFNSKIPSNNTSGYKGVYYDNTTKKWKATWREQGHKKEKTLNTKDEAIAYREKKAKAHYGEYYRET